MELIDYLLKITPVIANGLGVTVSLFLIVLVLSLPAGILAALLRLSPIGIVRKIMALYVYVMRGTPLMLQILFIYYGLPFIPYIGVQLDDTTAAVISFVLNYAAYLCEIFRGGIQSIPKGQKSDETLPRSAEAPGQYDCSGAF